MLKAEIKKEITITNKEIAQILLDNESIFDNINDILEKVLYDRYKMDYDARHDAVSQLTTADYIEILIHLANKVQSIR